MKANEYLMSGSGQQASISQLLEELVGMDPWPDPQLLDVLSVRMARSALADPSQSLGDVSPIIERLVIRGVDQLVVLDLVNTLCCAGAQIRPDLEQRVSRSLGELAGVGPPLALRMRVGLAAIVYGQLEVASRIAPEVPDLFVGSLEFHNDVLALLGYLTLAARLNAVPRVLDAAWRRVVGDLADLCSSGQLDESAVLWLARVIYQRFGKEPLGRVAGLAHAYLWENGSVAAPAAGRPDFPLTDTLAGGAYCIDQHLRGRGSQTLWLGTEVATGNRVFVASDGHTPEKQDIAALHRVLEYRIPGVFELAHVGTYDVGGSDRLRDARRASEWATVEKVTAGGWLPWALGPAEPWTAPAKAVALGRSAGRILMRASEAGVQLARIRPELMWAERRHGQLEVTGLSPRATELFARKAGEMVTHPVFDRFYYAPEVDRDPDDRAVAYALAVMMAQWATGRYPFAPKLAPGGIQVGEPEPIAAPAPLAQLLHATIRRNRGERPRLAEFVDALDRLAL